MGRTVVPIVMPPRAYPTRLEVAKSAYVNGVVEVEEFEWHVETLMRNGIADDPCPLRKSEPDDFRWRNRGS
jgi:hypothetical protein